MIRGGKGKETRGPNPSRQGRKREKCAKVEKETGEGSLGKGGREVRSGQQSNLEMCWMRMYESKK